MISIFYDLETTDTSPVGQILNYSFITVDDDYQELSRLTSLIKCNRLNLPSPGAILANKTDILKHQSLAVLDEPAACAEISDYIQGIIQEFGKRQVVMVGYNSNSFDLPFLRTMLIRNGYNPYFGTKNRDLMHVGQKLLAVNQEFLQLCQEFVSKSDWEKVRYKLEFFCQLFGLMEGAQTHFSEDDVLWTIGLSKIFHQRFAIDVRRYSAYEASPLEKQRGKVYQFNDLEEPRFLAFHSGYGNSRLWINAAKLAQAAESGNLLAAVEYFNAEKRRLYLDYTESVPDELQKSANKFIDQYPRINISDLFPPSECDIEGDIYRISARSFSLLQQKMQAPSGLAALTPDENQLVLRYRLRQAPSAATKSAEFRTAYQNYVQNRYSGELVIDKHGSKHPSYEQLAEELDQSLKIAEGRDAILLESLQDFYKESEVEAALNA